jgi:MinD-like ATPase involved in chromosome partitioning or flagellar assembly
MKNILIISENGKLKTELEKTGFFKNIKTSMYFSSTALEDVDILIVDDKTIGYSDYVQNFSKFLKLVNSNYYIATDIDTYSTINKVLSSYGIIVIPPFLTDKQICQKICSLAIEDFSVSKNTVCFFGSGSGVGTSMISQSVSQILSGITGKSTLFLNLDGSEGIDYFDINSASYGLSEIKERLVNNILSSEELKNSCIKSSLLYFLAGEKEISKVRHYQPEHIEKLVELASKTFDVVFINGGSTITGMSIGALNSSKLKLLVTTQSDKHYRNFSKLMDQIFINLGISADDFSLIVNKYIDSDELENEISLAKKYGMPLASVVPLLEYIPSLEAEKKKKTLLGYVRVFSSSINQLAVSICTELEIEILDTSKKDGKKGSFFKKILGKVQL